MASLVLILSELVRPHSQNTKPELWTTTTSSSSFSCVGTGTGAATAFPARKSMRSETNNNIQSEDMLLVEDLAEQRICFESIWPWKVYSLPFQDLRHISFVLKPSSCFETTSAYDNILFNFSFLVMLHCVFWLTSHCVLISVLSFFF